jgi:ribosome-associated toxin RatA of RatAB toxin-antitoxin module
MAKQSTHVLPGDTALIYEILTDYDHLAEWLPEIVNSRLLAREGDLALAELELGDSEKTRFAMECIHSPEQMVIWRPVEKKIPVTEFQWSLKPVDNGHCSVSLELDRPLSLGGFTAGGSGLMEPDQCLDALKNQVSIFLPDAALHEPGSETILEIVETATGLVCLLRGKKYRLVPEPGA